VRGLLNIAFRSPLLEALIRNKGKLVWLQPEFQSLGDAYDPGSD
jgi:hypothetical protein